jgi:endonuclease YncB( thermonuclease family)
MKKKILSFLLIVGVALGMMTGCQPAEDQTPQEVDYAAAVTLDMDSTETNKEEATVRMFIDGDTTHFNVSSNVPNTKQQGVLKARYLAINTPESTGKIEVWGKKASKFTKEKLSTAESIVLETDTNVWELDSTGDRHLVWVWYKPAGSTTYRNLNIEILQNGLAIASNSEQNRYGEICGKAIQQATALKLHVYSNEKDPDFYYGEAQQVTLKELRLNAEQYNGTKVAFEGVMTAIYDGGAYVESYDDETGIWFGMYIYYGFSVLPMLSEYFQPGYKFRIVGTLTFWEAGGSWQVSGLEFNARNPQNPNSCCVLDEENTYPAANVETTLARFNETIEIEMEDPETGDITTKEYKYCELAAASTIKMSNLRVVKTYTTNNGGDNDGAISITCEYGGQQIVVRTVVLRDANGDQVNASAFTGKTIDVTGIIDFYKQEGETEGSYQIKVLAFKDITIH